MSPWRFVRGWSDAELATLLAGLDGRERNFDPDAPMTLDRGWRRHASETGIGRERAGPPEPAGAFERARLAVARYEFSDPRIVLAHFDAAAPLDGRRMLLELRPAGFRFLAGTVVTEVRRERGERETVFGYRYDTLRGHLESGWEWFLLTKSHATGELRFRIEARWRPGDFPNAWSRIGFGFLAPTYQRIWTRRAHQRMRRIVEAGAPGPEAGARLLHGETASAQPAEETR